ncbi:MAG TPA: FMN-binding protein [Actinomycetales bacterium]|nr:FMN-binding protein [Actinomycetales bacterium]
MRSRTALLGTLLAAAALTISWREGANPSVGMPGVHVITAPAPRPSHSSSSPAAGGSSPRPSSRSTTSATHRYTGALVGTPYGDVQVQVVTSGSRITDVRAVHLTDANQHSRDISAFAAPRLKQEALSSQSANIDTVSGATYTSEGYRQSLQAALDQAHA